MRALVSVTLATVTIWLGLAIWCMLRVVRGVRAVLPLCGPRLGYRGMLGGHDYH